jgi:hypothetical protein
MSTTLVDGYAEDLAARCCTEVRDVEVAVRTECHTGRKGKSGGYIFDIADAVKAYNLAIARSWEAGSGRELERIEEAIRAEVDGNDCGEAGSRSRETKTLLWLRQQSQFLFQFPQRHKSKGLPAQSRHCLPKFGMH